MQVIETKVYNFNELSDNAKEKARDWYKENGLDYDWYSSDYDDAKNIGTRMGITISQIFFKGFSSQGDGACFESTFEGLQHSNLAVKNYAPDDKKLHSIADDWEALQKAHGYRLKGRTTHKGFYYHEKCTCVQVEIEPENDTEERYEFDMDNSYVRDNNEPGAQATIILRRLMVWIYNQLEKQYDYLNSNEFVDENICANEYTFTADGKRFG